MIVSSKTQDIDFSQDVNDLLCEIDTWLASKAKRKYDSDRYGERIHINYEDYKLLSKYRDILSDKAYNDCCLEGYLIDDIISRIKQLLNRN